MPINQSKFKEPPHGIRCSECGGWANWLPNDSKYQCANCDATFDPYNYHDLIIAEVSTKFVKEAQFGGNSQMGHPWAPGQGPFSFGKSQKNTSQGVADISLDNHMEPTRLNTVYDPKRNIEKMLESQHMYAEEDAIPYDLSPAARERLKIKREVHRREQFYKDVAKNTLENNPKYIREHYQAKPEHLISMEASLQSRRKLDDKHYDPREDIVPEQIKPERYHTVSQSDDDNVRLAAPSTQHGLNTIFDTPRNDEEQRDKWNPSQIRWNDPQLGHTPLLTTGADFDDYFNQLQDAGPDNAGAHQETLAFDHPGSDQTRDKAPITDPIPSMLSNMNKQDSNPFMSIEGNLSQMHTPQTPARLPNDKLDEFGDPKSKNNPQDMIEDADKHPDMTTGPKMPRM